MRFLFLLCFLAASSYALDIDIPVVGGLLKDLPLPDLNDLNPLKIGEIFKQFKSEFKKNYKDSAESTKALKSFGDNLKKIIELNLKFKDKKVEFGINQFTDLTEQEFKEKVLMKTAPSFLNSTIISPDSSRFKLITAPSAYDWRTNKAVVGPIKNQGSCGCCWAFTAAALITAANGIKYKTLKEASEQQLCECSLGEGAIGCNGGWPEAGLLYAVDPGVSSVSGYTAYSATRATKPYTCTDTNSPNDMHVTDVYEIYPSSAVPIRDFLYQYGPIGVAFAVGPSFQFYKSGIFNNNDCTTNEQGWHAVAVVGYGTENGTPFWIIKNSWGTGWGESGYIRYYRGSDLCKLESTVANFAVA